MDLVYLFKTVSLGACCLILSNCEKSVAEKKQILESSDKVVLFTKSAEEESNEQKKSLAMNRFPTLMINGKVQIVAPSTYITAKLKGINTKYHAVAVPDG